MGKILDTILIKRHKLIVAEKDVMAILRSIDDVNHSSKVRTFTSMEICRCEDIADKTAWTLSFRLTNAKWKRLIRVLKESKRNIVLDENDRYYLVSRVEA